MIGLKWQTLGILAPWGLKISFLIVDPNLQFPSHIDSSYFQPCSRKYPHPIAKIGGMKGIVSKMLIRPCTT